MVIQPAHAPLLNSNTNVQQTDMYTVMHGTDTSTCTGRLDDGQKLVPDSGLMLIDSESLKILLPKVA